MANILTPIRILFNGFYNFKPFLKELTYRRIHSLLNFALTRVVLRAKFKGNIKLTSIVLALLWDCFFIAKSRLGGFDWFGVSNNFGGLNNFEGLNFGGFVTIIGNMDY